MAVCPCVALNEPLNGSLFPLGQKMILGSGLAPTGARISKSSL